MVLGLASVAHADLIVNAPGTGSTRTDVWTAEAGGSMPAGTGGFVDGTLFVTSAGLYTFIAGGNGLVPGDSNHGDSVFPNEFKILGNIFCTQNDPACGGVKTPVGTKFTLFLPVGPIPFTLAFGPTTNNTLTNGQVNDAVGASIAECGPVSPAGTTGAQAGPCTTAYIGLSDSPYPADHDFQDLVVTVVKTPEPSALLLLGLGLIGGIFVGRKRKDLAA